MAHKWERPSLVTGQRWRPRGSHFCDEVLQVVQEVYAAVVKVGLLRYLFTSTKDHMAATVFPRYRHTRLGQQSRSERHRIVGWKATESDRISMWWWGVVLTGTMSDARERVLLGLSESWGRNPFWLVEGRHCDGRYKRHTGT